MATAAMTRIANMVAPISLTRGVAASDEGSTVVVITGADVVVITGADVVVLLAVDIVSALVMAMTMLVTVCGTGMGTGRVGLGIELLFVSFWNLRDQ